MGKLSSMFKKMNTLVKNGTEPYEEGKANFELVVPKIEELAAERAKTCLDCEHFSEEPIQMFKIQDLRIPEISEMMCGTCGCSSPYLLRQNLEICIKWQE